MQFVRNLLHTGTLKAGDIFVVDNCSVHIQGDNISMQESLCSNYGIRMITLPPYCSEFNPTELVSNTLIQRLCSIQARYNTVNEMEFVDDIGKAMNVFYLHDAKVFYSYQC